MSSRCLHCNHELPSDIPLATCPFCLKRLHASGPDGDAKGTVAIKTASSITAPDAGKTYGGISESQPVSESLAKPLLATPAVFRKTYVLEDLEVHFSSNGVSETLAVSAADPLRSMASSSVPKSESSATQDDHAEKPMPDTGIGGTLIASDLPCDLPIADNVRVLPEAELVPSGQGESQQTLVDGEQVLPGTIDLPLQDDDSLQSECSADGSMPLVRSGSSVGSRSTKIGSDQVRRHWANAAGDSANPMHTVKADMRDSRTSDSLNLPVKLRSVALQAVPIDDNADYQLIQKLGEGAMGLIHKAKQHSIDRFVAFKTIKKDIADQSPETRRKFLREAQITGSLDHPNIVPIHDLGISEDGSLFYSMKLVEGTPWQEVISQRSRDENLETLLKVCDAVAFAHSRDVIHRDLKPENVMLGQFGEVLVMDWGLAISQRKDRDRTFSLGGTPAYMAPEMARHEVKKIGDASDIYLLGAILYQIVTGYPPHPGGTVTECVQMAGENVIIPPPDPDDELIKIALRAMSTKPEQRHRAVAEFQDAIRGYRRNAESVALTHRAQAAFDEAIEQQNYEQFSKAMFGFSDAVEIWPENAAAKIGIDRARMEYGRCALKRGDFDLALQLLREDVGDEQPLYKKALQGKREAAEKERRIRRLRTSVLAVVSVALLGAFGFSGVLAKTNATLKLEKEQKEVALKKEEEALKDLKNQKLIVDAALEEVTKEKLRADKARDDATTAAENERIAAAEAKRQEGIAISANKGLNEQKEIAERKAKEADESRVAAVEAQKAEAVQNRLNSFKNYPAKLNLASVRVRRQQDVTRSGELLKEIQDLEREMLEREVKDKFDPSQPKSTTPLMQNWVYRRVKLLGNADLPRLSLGARVTCVDTAPEANRLAVGTQSGLIAIVSVGKDRLEIVKKMQAPDGLPIEAIALAPRGDAIAYCSENNTHFWQLNAAAPERLSIKGKGTVIRFTSPLPYLAVGIGTRLYLLGTDPNSKPVEGPKLVPGFAAGGDVRVISSVPGRPNLLACLVVQNESNELQQRLRLLDLAKQERPLNLELPAEIGEVRHFEFIDSNRLAVGTANGKLLPFELKSDETPWRLNPLTPLQTDVHTTAIQAFAFSPERSWMISVAEDSPAIQLWRSGTGERESNWKYAWPLLGHGVEQVIAVDFFGGRKRAVSVDKAGQCILWDPERISKRHRIANRPHFELPVAAGFELPVVSGITSGNASQSDLVLTINQLGVLDRWPLSECDDIQSLAARDWDYNGHPPGAELWDAAITPDGRKLITSAIIKDHRLESSNRQFCLWDVDRRTMLARWGDNEAGNPVLAISADGSTVVIGGIQTHVVTFVDGKRSTPIPITDGGIQPGAFSLATRPNSAEVALAGDGGSVRTIELKPPYRVLAKHEYGRTSGKVQRALWDAKGQYLFLLLDQGAVHALQWPRQIGNSGRAISGIKMPIASHREMDAEVKIRSDGKPVLELALRYNDEFQKQKTQRFTFDMDPADGTLVQRPRGDAIAGNHWLVPQAPAGEPSRLLADLKLNKVQLLRSDSTGKRLVAFDHYGIHIIDTEKRQSRTLWVRQSDVEDASLATTRDGSWRAVTLNKHTENKHADIWFAMPLEADRQGEVSWRPLNRDYKTITQLALSPDAEKLGILDDTKGTMELEVIPLNVNATKKTEPLDGVEAFAWHPDADKLVAWTPAANNAGGKLRLQSLDGKPETLAYPRELDNPDRLDVKRLAFYRESFANPQVPPKWHVVIQADLKSQDVAQKENLAARSQIFLVPLDQTNLQANDDSSFIKLPTLEAVTAIAASSTENLLAIGTQSGTISLWLMAPSLDKKEAFEIYDFDDHRGSPIRSLAFGADGNTLISADSRGRQYAWLSTD